MSNKKGIKVADKAANAAIFANQAEKIVQQADVLYAARESYENGTLARSNKELYGILGSVYGLFVQAFEGKCLADTTKAMKKALNARGVKVQGNTPALTVFVRYVFNSDRKRAYNYTATLMAAIQANVKPEGLSQFIADRNGVEECKRVFKKKAEVIERENVIRDATADVLQMLATMDAVQTITLQDSSVDLIDAAQFALILARPAANGKFEVLRAVPRITVGMQNAAIKEVTKAVVEQRAVVAKLALAQKVGETTIAAVASATVRQLEAA